MSEWRRLFLWFLILLVFFGSTLYIPSVSAQENFTVTIGQDKLFTQFNYHDSWFENDPKNPEPWPDQRAAYSEGNTAYVSLSATPGHAGVAQALVGVDFKWDLGQYTWEEVKDWPVNVTINFSYQIKAYWVEGNGSANAGVAVDNFLGPDFDKWYDFVGYEAKEIGSQGKTVSETYQTTVEELGEKIVLRVYCQAHSVLKESSQEGTIHYSSSQVTIESIKIHFVSTGKIKGKVWDVQFLQDRIKKVTPIQGADVWATRVGASTASAYAKTNEAGAFALEDLEPGIYEVGVGWESPSGYKTYSPQRVKVSAGETVWIEFPQKIVEVIKQLYKAKALQDYSRLKLKYLNITREYFIQKIGISLIALPYGLINAVRVGTLQLVKLAEELYTSYAQDTVSSVLVGIFQSAANREIEQLRKIASDPPDADYTAVFELQRPEPLTLPADYNGLISEKIVQLANALADQGAIEEALLVSFERYQGALAAERPEYMAKQAEAFINYADLLRRNDEELREAVAAVRAEFKLYEEEIGSTLQQLQTQLSQKGFATQERQDLRDLGFTDTDIETYKDLLLTFNFGDLIESLDSLASTSESRAKSVSDLANRLQQILVFLTAGQLSFPDCDISHWAYGYLAYLSDRKIISGYPDGTARPLLPVTRAEFAKMIVAAMGWEQVEPGVPTFKDVSKGFWAYKYIETARARGVLSGFPDGTFKPRTNITRAEIAAMIVRARAYRLVTSGLGFTDIAADHWARDYILTAKSLGLIAGYPDGSFRPENSATRAEAAKMIYGILK